VFLRGCGLAPWEVLAAKIYDPEMTPVNLAELQYRIFDAWTKGKGMVNGCFISYSWLDGAFVEKLCKCLMNNDINVWLDRHDMVAGDMQQQVWRAIQIHHVAIIVLSKHSVKSDWVENELEMARHKEKSENRAVLCPVALDDAWKTKTDASRGPGDPSRHLWRILDRKFVVDFSDPSKEAFDISCQKLIRGLRTNYGPHESAQQSTPDTDTAAWTG
jgi:TIR domain